MPGVYLLHLVIASQCAEQLGCGVDLSLKPAQLVERSIKIGPRRDLSRWRLEVVACEIGCECLGRSWRLSEGRAARHRKREEPECQLHDCAKSHLGSHLE